MRPPENGAEGGGPRAVGRGRKAPLQEGVGAAAGAQLLQPRGVGTAVFPQTVVWSNTVVQNFQICSSDGKIS